MSLKIAQPRLLILKISIKLYVKGGTMLSDFAPGEIFNKPFRTKNQLQYLLHSRRVIY
jgi:hypothetical protein